MAEVIAGRYMTSPASVGENEEVEIRTDATGRLLIGNIGSGASDLGKAEDAVHASGDVGVMSLTVRQDTASALGAAGDYVPLLTDANGRLHAILSSLEKAEDAVHASGDMGIQLLTVRKDTATVLAGADGDYAPLETEANGALHVNLATLIAGEDQTNDLLRTLMKPVSSATYAATLYQNVAGSVTKAVIKASAGNVYAVRFTNLNAAARWFQLHNKATAPAAAETPQLSFYVPGNSILELGSAWFAPSSRFATGIGWAVSTAAGTFTDAATAGEHETIVRYM